MANATAITLPAPTFGAALMRAIKSFGLLRESWVGMIGAGLVLFWVIVALLAPLIAQKSAMVAVFVAVGTQMIADIGYTYLNPRIRFS